MLPRAGWLGHRRIHLEECDSTNDEAARLARAGAAHGTVVTAAAQRAGRGRQGRAWASPPGLGLYLSAVVRPPLPLALVPPMTLAIGVGVCEAARAAGADARLKWPNDVLARGRKLAGVLVEAQSQGGRLDAVIIGIGVNLGGALPPEVAARAITLAEAVERASGEPAGEGARESLERASGEPAGEGARELLERASGEPAGEGARESIDSAAPAAFTDALLGHVETWLDRYTASGLPAVIDAWHARMAPALAVRAVIDGASVEGQAAGLDEGGALLLRDAGGRVHRVRSGDVDMIAC